MMNNTITGNPASYKQRALVQKLAAERPDWTDHLNGANWERCFDIVNDPSKFASTREASAVIDALFAVPRPALAQPEVGVYVMPDGTIVQAKPNQSKTNVYTKRWVEINGQRLVDATEERVHGEWEYAPELKRQIDQARKMTLDEAKEFILRYGQCVRCARRLKAAESVERGIGPVCVKYFSVG